LHPLQNLVLMLLRNANCDPIRVTHNVFTFLYPCMSAFELNGNWQNLNLVCSTRERP
jgi:hypothetical protein